MEEILNTNRELYDEIYGADDAYWMLQNNVMQNQWLKRTSPEIASLREWTIPSSSYTSHFFFFFVADSVFSTILALMDYDLF